MKQITIVIHGDFVQLGGINNFDQAVEYEVTESRLNLILGLAGDMDLEKDPFEDKIDRLTDYLKTTGDESTLLEFIDIWDNWTDRIGDDLDVGDLVVHEDVLYTVIQPITAMAHQPPDMIKAHYKVIAPPGQYLDWAPPTGAHDAPNKGEKRWHSGKLWESLIDGNTVEPGTDDRYWKDITEA